MPTATDGPLAVAPGLTLILGLGLTLILGLGLALIVTFGVGVRLGVAAAVTVAVIVAVGVRLGLTVSDGEALGAAGTIIGVILLVSIVGLGERLGVGVAVLTGTLGETFAIETPPVLTGSGVVVFAGAAFKLLPPLFSAKAREVRAGWELAVVLGAGPKMLGRGPKGEVTGPRTGQPCGA